MNPHSDPTGFYWGHQCSWAPANSMQVYNMQSDDYSVKYPGTRQGLNLPCPRSLNVILTNVTWPVNSLFTNDKWWPHSRQRIFSSSQKFAKNVGKTKKFQNTCERVWMYYAKKLVTPSLIQKLLERTFGRIMNKGGGRLPKSIGLTFCCPGFGSAFQFFCWKWYLVVQKMDETYKKRPGFAHIFLQKELLNNWLVRFTNWKRKVLPRCLPIGYRSKIRG